MSTIFHGFFESEVPAKPLGRDVILYAVRMGNHIGEREYKWYGINEGIGKGIRRSFLGEHRVTRTYTQIS